MKKVVVFLADGFEEVEAFTPIDYLRRTNQVQLYTVAIPSPTMNNPYHAISSHKIPVVADLRLEEMLTMFKLELPDMIFCPGGMPGSSHLAAEKRLMDFIKKCFAAGKYVSAICAAPAVVLAKTGALKGKKWTCYPDMEKNVIQYCGEEADPEKVLAGSQHVTDAPFVTDGTVITSRGAGCAEQFAMELVRLLCGEEMAKKIHDATVQR